MSAQKQVLHLLCGKIAAGKSTLAEALASEPATLLLCEDRWLSRLYPGEIISLEDYLRCSGRLREVMGDHVRSLLQAGLSVVLDFPANTVSGRRWMRGLFEGVKVDHRLHFLDLPDAVCKARLRKRNEEGGHDFAVGEADFDLITSYFEPPSEAEGFSILVHRGL